MTQGNNDKSIFIHKDQTCPSCPFSSTNAKAESCPFWYQLNDDPDYGECNPISPREIEFWALFCLIFQSKNKSKKKHIDDLKEIKKEIDYYFNTNNMHLKTISDERFEKLADLILINYEIDKKLKIYYSNILQNIINRSNEEKNRTCTNDDIDHDQLSR